MALWILSQQVLFCSSKKYVWFKSLIFAFYCGIWWTTPKNTLNYASLSSSELDDQMFTTLYASLCIGNANFRQIFVKPFGVKFSNEWKGGASCEERWYYITFFVCFKEFMQDYWAKTYIFYLLFFKLDFDMAPKSWKNSIWLLHPNDFSR